jgi:hypothetical protein
MGRRGSKKATRTSTFVAVLLVGGRMCSDDAYGRLRACPIGTAAGLIQVGIALL